ncbi:MAG: hypothetical protein IJP05_07010, partial [Oscillospiraceae bacterium]|nr:hypothetical protein [Oscillospiraceae bacterium]
TKSRRPYQNYSLYKSLPKIRTSLRKADLWRPFLFGEDYGTFVAAKSAYRHFILDKTPKPLHCRSSSPKNFLDFLGTPSFRWLQFNIIIRKKLWFKRTWR